MYNNYARATGMQRLRHCVQFKSYEYDMIMTVQKFLLLLLGEVVHL